MVIFHETKGSDEGLALFDRWSEKGNKYRGIKEIESKWRSFRPDVETPLTIATLIMMAQKAGADVEAIMLQGEPDFEVCECEISNLGIEITDIPLTKYSLRGRIHELEKQAVEKVLILGSIVLLGQATVIYAKPNTGKTLIMFFMIIEAIKGGHLDPSKLYYINMDDDSCGLVEKAKIAEEYGFQMLADGHQGFNARSFRDAMDEMIKNNNAHGVIVILDTLKKFVNIMDKGHSSNFGKIIRQFVLNGGTVIALSNTNKHPDSNGKPIFSGTSDIVEDFDCAYTMATLSEEAADCRKVVEFQNFKHRGNVAKSAAYSYAMERKISYDELLLSVEEVDPEQLKPIKQAVETRTDAEVINAIEICIKKGINTKMKLATTAAEHAKVSHKTALRIIEKYTGEDPANYRWSFAVRDRGAKVYELLKHPAEPAPNPTKPTP